MTAGESDQAAPVRHLARHATGAAFTRVMELCEDAVRRSPGLHHLARYSQGVLDLAVDTLDTLDDLPRPADTDRLRAECRIVGAQLGFKFGSLDQTLQEARTGPLIRLVLHAEGGVAYCNAVTPEDYLVGFTLGAPGAADEALSMPELPWVRASDRALAELTNRLREQVSLGTQNPGGWLTEPPPAEGMGTPSAPRFVAGEAGVRVEALGTGRGAGSSGAPAVTDDAVLTAIRRALHPDSLSYVGHHRDDAAARWVDLFEHESVAHYFQRIAPVARRRFYQGFGRQLRFLTGQLGQLIAPVLGGRLVRVVLDVEQGASYYYRLDAGEYLFGVTLNQSAVSVADDRMGRLVWRVQQG